SPSGIPESLAAFTEFNVPVTYHFVPEETGIFRLTSDVGAHSVAMLRSTVPVAMCGTPHLALVATRNPIYFRVPEETKEFSLNVIGMCAERVNATLYDPDGDEVWKHENIAQMESYVSEEGVPPRPGIWRIEFAKPTVGVLEDFGVRLLGVPPVFMISEPIDRYTLVNRHRIEWNDPTGVIPLGNGEFCFGADATGLQTFAGNTLSHWGWHTSPLPDRATKDDVPYTGTTERGRLTGPMQRASDRSDVSAWMFCNPHIANLLRVRFIAVKPAGDPTGPPEAAAIRPEDLTELHRSYDPWTGEHRSRFVYREIPVTVRTCVHPQIDAVSVQIESGRLPESGLCVAVDFPHPTTDRGPWLGDFRVKSPIRVLRRSNPERVDLEHDEDGITCHVSMNHDHAIRLLTDEDPGRSEYAPSDPRHRAIILVPEENITEFTIACAPSTFRTSGENPENISGNTEEHPLTILPDTASSPVPDRLPGYQATCSAAAQMWKTYWRHGGAIDLSRSRDPRWIELERRIVLSQYLMRACGSGSYPPAESSLTDTDAWHGQFHMEMIWWHEAHFALWNRPELSEKALSCYEKFLPVARDLAAQFGYIGARWGKQVGPEGRTAPWMGSFVLHWQQPHPIFFAEQAYRLNPTPETLEKWKTIVFETADYLADFPTFDETDGFYHLTPIMPPSEQGITHDTVFDLAYFRYGLTVANTWRERLGMERNLRWDEVRTHLAPLPQKDGVYVHSPEWADETWGHRAYEHPDLIGVYGMLPPLDGVDPEVARRTVVKVDGAWAWDRTWGWDCPWFAMAAARVGEPQLAVDSLLRNSQKNQFDVRGVNIGWYFPGNGGLLYAAAMMAAGWDGAPQRHAPGFPDDGSWTVRWEGLNRAQ
ncbi:MAG: hypothetical protein Q4C47_06855, partial [Planctomycetia bacterium]|nr:hypothetical protein [Planctomycetia bacterium]